MFYIALPTPFHYLILTLDDNERVTSAFFSHGPQGVYLPYSHIEKDIHDFIKGEKKRLETEYVLPRYLSPFSLSVLHAIEQIPYGKVFTYKEIGEFINRQGAVRAIGSVCAKNPLALFVPCHRVVRTSGEVFSYAWGPERKKELITLEKSLHLL